MSVRNARFARPPRHWRSRAARLGAILLLGVAAWSACAAPIQYARPVHEDQARFVKLEARYGYGQDSPALRFAHPVHFDRSQWDRFLEQVRIIDRGWIFPTTGGESGAEAAFRGDERDYLAAHLAAAFAKARADEWVLFYLSWPRPSGVQEITSGGLFVEGHSLHLVLANYRLSVSMAHVAEQIRHDPLRPAGDSYYAFVPGQRQEARTYHDWHLRKPLLEHPMALVTELQALLASPQSAEAGASDRAADLERRFRALEQLRANGLITEQEYERKRSELLDAL